MPSWFTISMGTGVLANSIASIPYDIAAIRVVGCIVFFTNIVIFTLLLAIQTAQLCLYPQIISYMRSHPRRMLHYGAISMALGTIVGGLDRYRFAESSAVVLYLGWSIWWISVVLAVVSATLLAYLLVSKKTQSIEAVTGAWLLLVAPLTVSAASGGIYAEYLPTHLAMIAVIAGYCLLGAGMSLTCSLVVLYLHRITVYKLPARDLVLTSFIPLGPLSQIGVAGMVLGSLSQEIVPQALPQVEPLGATMFHLGIILGLFSWGCSILALLHAVFSVLYQRRSAEIPFNISWWALVFPIGVFTLLTAKLSQMLEIRFFEIAFLLLVAVLFALWLFNIVRTAIGTWTGSIFGISELTQPCECCSAEKTQDEDVLQMA
ncbi:Plasma membrane sulfite pump involved in sulfite metabolism [Coemansia sp. RSA 2598]|nr:Plasma membrane sulfite pump involved in sulfite metabolism [Coemansia sp. RSA 2598]